MRSTDELLAAALFATRHACVGQLLARAACTSLGRATVLGGSRSVVSASDSPQPALHEVPRDSVGRVREQSDALVRRISETSGPRTGPKESERFRHGRRLRASIHLP